MHLKQQTQYAALARSHRVRLGRTVCPPPICRSLQHGNAAANLCSCDTHEVLSPMSESLPVPLSQKHVDKRYPTQC
eukprot:6174200-Pleurochrysis_carterae.AAC.8